MCSYWGDNIFFDTDGDSIKAANLKVNTKISFSANAMPKFVTIDGITATLSANEIS
jgi:nitrous oxidase accessory protein NosD